MNYFMQLLYSLALFTGATAKEHSFVIVICSYNNESICEKNLESVFEQTYPHYRVIYTEDCSQDRTFEKVKAFVDKSDKKSKVTLIKNAERKGAMENIYRAVQSCKDNEIVVMLDGDDWFYHKNVLKKLNRYYADSNVWMTFGSYIYYPSGMWGECSQPIPLAVIQQNKIRQYVHAGWPLSHLKSFYATLFNQIKKEDFMWDGKFLDSTSDQALMLPLFEMAGMHALYIPEVLYVNNRDNPLNDDKVAKDRQTACMLHVWSLPSYQPLLTLPCKE